MADAPQWYHTLISSLMKERNLTAYGLSRIAGVSDMPIRNILSNKPVSLSCLEKIFAALSYDMTAVPREVITPIPKPTYVGQREAMGQVSFPLPPRKAPIGDPDSYCWGCGKEGTMISVHGHLQCALCRYIDPCCED